jgi:hypothetical protein
LSNFTKITTRNLREASKEPQRLLLLKSKQEKGSAALGSLQHKLPYRSRKQKEPSVVVHTCDPSAQEIEAGES